MRTMTKVRWIFWWDLLAGKKMNGGDDRSKSAFWGQVNVQIGQSFIYCGRWIWCQAVSGWFIYLFILILVEMVYPVYHINRRSTVLVYLIKIKKFDESFKGRGPNFFTTTPVI